MSEYAPHVWSKSMRPSVMLFILCVQGYYYTIHVHSSMTIFGWIDLFDPPFIDGCVHSMAIISATEQLAIWQASTDCLYSLYLLLFINCFIGVESPRHIYYNIVHCFYHLYHLVCMISDLERTTITNPCAHML